MSKSRKTMPWSFDFNPSPEHTSHIVHLLSKCNTDALYITPVTSGHGRCTYDDLYANESSSLQCTRKSSSHTRRRVRRRTAASTVFDGTSRPLIAFGRLAAVCRRRRGQDERGREAPIICAADRTGDARPGQESREIEEIAPSFRRPV